MASEQEFVEALRAVFEPEEARSEAEAQEEAAKREREQAEREVLTAALQRASEVMQSMVNYFGARVVDGVITLKSDDHLGGHAMRLKWRVSSGTGATRYGLVVRRDPNDGLVYMSEVHQQRQDFYGEPKPTAPTSKLIGPADRVTPDGLRDWIAGNWFALFKLRH